MWTLQPLVPNIHLPTDEDAQEDFGASIICLLHSLWSQWEKDFYSKFKNVTFESLNSILVAAWDADTASRNWRESKFCDIMDTERVYYFI